MRSVPQVILGVAPNLVTDEAFIMLHMFSSFYRGETNGINVHGIRVSSCSTPLIATGEDSTPQMILTLLSQDLRPSSYLTSSSLIIGLIVSSAGSLTLVCVSCFHHVLLSSIHFLFYMLFLGPCALVHSI